MDGNVVCTGKPIGDREGLAGSREVVAGRRLRVLTTEPQMTALWG